MKKLLITGFQPFGGADTNPSWLAVQALPDVVGEYELCKLEIPVVFAEGAAVVLSKAKEIQADLVIAVGMAGGRESVTPERIAVNIQDARIPDNAGNQPRGAFVAADGPAAYFSTLPVEKMVCAMENAGIKATVSNSAGAYVCNDVMYSLLHAYAGTDVRTGFIHVPYIPGQGTPCMELEWITKALELAIGVC